VDYTFFFLCLFYIDGVEPAALKGFANFGIIKNINR